MSVANAIRRDFCCVSFVVVLSSSLIVVDGRSILDCCDVCHEMVGPTILCYESALLFYANFLHNTNFTLTKSILMI